MGDLRRESEIVETKHGSYYRMPEDVIVEEEDAELIAGFVGYLLDIGFSVVDGELKRDA